MDTKYKLYLTNSELVFV